MQETVTKSPENTRKGIYFELDLLYYMYYNIIKQTHIHTNTSETSLAYLNGLRKNEERNEEKKESIDKASNDLCSNIPTK